MKRRWYLYILLLEQGKWFVGISPDPKRRYHQHVSGRGGTKWTRIYKPVRMDKVIDLKTANPYIAQYYEEMMTKKLEARFGRVNVRGGDKMDINQYIRWFGLRLSRHLWESIVLITLLSIGVGYLILDRFKLLPW